MQHEPVVGCHNLHKPTIFSILREGNVYKIVVLRYSMHGALRHSTRPTHTLPHNPGQKRATSHIK